MEPQQDASRPSLCLLYHELRPSGSSYSYVVDTSDFERHLELFQTLRNSPQAFLPVISFDDGHISNFTHAAPLLERHRLHAHFFITAGWTGRREGYMGWNDLRALVAAGHSIGGHGWSHKLLTHCSDEELQTELNRTRLTLEDALGVPITSMSLPGGRYDARVLSRCGTAGYTQIFTSEPRSQRQRDATTVGRVNIRGDMKLESIASLLQPSSGVLDRMRRQHAIKSAAKSCLGDRLYDKLWGLLNRREKEEPDAAAAEAE